MKMHSVDPRIVSVWRLRLAMSFGLFVTLVFVSAALRAELWLAISIAGLGVLVAGWCWWWPAKRYERLRFGIDETGIRIESGVWWQSIVALPRARVQHSDVAQGPLQRRYGVATLSFYTAGSAYLNVSLPGLAYADAIAVRDSLVGMTEGGSGV